MRDPTAVLVHGGTSTVIESDASGNPIFLFTESRTDLLLPQLGVTIRF